MPRGRNTESDNGGRKPRQYMRNVPTHSFRLTVIDHYDSHGMPVTLERFYPGVAGLPKETKRKSVYLWAKSREKLVRLCKAQAKSELRRSQEIGRATKVPRDAEMDPIKWINGYRLERAPISAVTLTRKSLQIASDVGVSATAFTASWTWRQAFLAEFSSELQQRTGELGVDVVQNTDQTPVFFEHISTKTIENKGTQTV
uniref:Uncharacterized protein AlNc14C31G2891 n=1 Tax=Albugo laibachii Nc14 TaxID=890382 RepID=F0W7T8_9STRA|nr:conserved hypothetical protein [Albugo laibachii Nc14]|eukprot:CCA17190.1 conserved hypothetical protein [Albugo laibachii Nc14]